LEHQRPFKLPRIASVRLSSFDLFRVDPDPCVAIDKRVLCLVGANGLGKSTFLNTLNYGITGAIPDPDREYKSPEEYLTDASRADRIEQYFSGRVSELRRPLASVTVELVWAEVSITVTRDIFERHGVSRLEIRRGSNVNILVREESDNLKDRYEAEVVAASEIPSFDRFVFLYHFVFTFDEGRHLISWDDRAVTDALYLAFGGKGDATKSAKLTRDMERASSRARNTRFMAKAVTDRIKSLQAILDGDSDDVGNEKELIAQRDSLEKEQALAERRLDEIDRDRQAADLKWAETSAKISDRQARYRQVFASRAVRSGAISFHPAVKATLDDNKCAVCHTIGVGHILAAHLDRGACPLCGTVVGQVEAGDDVIQALKELDAELLGLRHEMEQVLAERSRLESARQSAAGAVAASNDALEAFFKTAGGEVEIERLKGRDWAAGEIQKQIDERGRLLKQASAHRESRDKIRQELRRLDKQVQSAFDVAARVFVPRFRDLAQQFIGLPIDVEAEQRSGVEAAGFRLKLTMDDQLRSSAQRLSESQRFFIDIALRMALSEMMTDGASTLFIDTPEGSLDIAYEARAGQMFDSFVRGGNYIVMTANLRSSALLINLAKLSGREGMELIRMTDWTELTEVQAQEETRLDEAYAQIEKALG
jgi:energy-coupling factor transporter ATP-binding protein EcfA2